jgi:hypothetical protein
MALVVGGVLAAPMVYAADPPHQARLPART